MTDLLADNTGSVHPRQRPVFDDAFDVWFPAALGDRTDVAAPQRIPTNEAERREAAVALRLELEAALAAGDRAALDRLWLQFDAEHGDGFLQSARPLRVELLTAKADQWLE